MTNATLADLTPAQRRALPLLSAVVEWSIGETPKNARGSVRHDVLARLKERGIAVRYSLHPYGTSPVYAATLTDEGKALLRGAREELLEFARGTFQAWIQEVHRQGGSVDERDCPMLSDAGFDAWLAAVRRSLRKTVTPTKDRGFLHAVEVVGREEAKNLTCEAWTIALWGEP